MEAISRTMNRRVTKLTTAASPDSARTIPLVNRFPWRPTEPSGDASPFGNNFLVDIFEKPCGQSLKTIPQDRVLTDRRSNCHTWMARVPAGEFTMLSVDFTCNTPDGEIH
ncbi:hypothetical protein Bbelb_352770 [Branchiostoma belcheri]|nr:hypothetical protein Bbelb_352770 [Branchiostoma belcheri]